MSYRSHVAAPSRVFDHLYDPIFTTSDQKNVYKENCVALTRSAPIHVYPVYDSMFTELNYEERNCYAYQRNVLPFSASQPSVPQRRLASVTGVDRPKFFSNPISNVRTINIGLMADKGATESHDESQAGKYRTTAMQTLYRESSAQTRAWLPECFTEDVMDDVPEVVYIADMIDSVTYPGLREVEIIERARKRRSWELSLPPIKQAEEIPTRVAALEAFEWEEWIAREKDINECQQARLKIVADLIARREERHRAAANAKVENCKRRALEERSRQKDLLIRNYQRSMRKLDLAQRKDQMRDKRDDPVLAHYDKKTEFSFPKIRLDAISKKRTQIEYASEFESRFTALEQDNAVGEDVQRYLRPNRRELWLPKEQTREVERGIWNENYLKRLHETLKQFRRKKYPKRKLPARCVSYESAVSVPRTPSLLPSASFDRQVDRDYQDNVLIQKTIKGRAIQGMLQRGMKKFQDVIEEAKETHSIAAVRKLFPKEFSQQIDNQHQILGEYRRIEEALRSDSKLQEELKKVESKDTSNLLSFLEKEFNRLQGEKRAHAMYLLAERERYRREAETLSTGDFDDQFKNDAITLYLENILLDGINRAMDDDSREYIRKVAQKLDRKASKTVTFHEAIEEFSNESNTEDVSDESVDVGDIPDERVVMELLKDNMVPQIMDRIKNEQKIAQQKRLLMQAHIDLHHDEFEQIRLEEKQQICADIVAELIEVATYEPAVEEVKPTRQNSAEAEALAAQIVEQILNEIMDNEIFDVSMSVTDSSTSRDYDGDDSNVQSTSETESSTDFLAKRIVVGVLNDIIESGIAESTSEFTEETSDSY